MALGSRRVVAGVLRVPRGNSMDLNEVIAELRSELETLDRIVDSMEKLAVIRTGPRNAESYGSPLAALSKRRSRKAAPEMAKATAATS